MTATGHYNGNPIEYVDGEWRYLDGEIADTSRPCPRCGRLQTTAGDDACLGHLPGVSSACCGHGIKPGYVRYTNGMEVRYSGEDGTWEVCSDGRPIAWFVDKKMAKEYAKPAPEDETRTYNCGGLPVDLTLPDGEHDYHWRAYHRHIYMHGEHLSEFGIASLCENTVGDIEEGIEKMNRY